MKLYLNFTIKSLIDIMLTKQSMKMMTSMYSMNLILKNSLLISLLSCSSRSKRNWRLSKMLERKQNYFLRKIKVLLEIRIKVLMLMRIQWIKKSIAWHLTFMKTELNTFRIFDLKCLERIQIKVRHARRLSNAQEISLKNLVLLVDFQHQTLQKVLLEKPHIFKMRIKNLTSIKETQ